MDSLQARSNSLSHFPQNSWKAVVLTEVKAPSFSDLNQSPSFLRASVLLMLLHAPMTLERTAVHALPFFKTGSKCRATRTSRRLPQGRICLLWQRLRNFPPMQARRAYPAAIIAGLSGFLSIKIPVFRQRLTLAIT